MGKMDTGKAPLKAISKTSRPEGEDPHLSLSPKSYLRPPKKMEGKELGSQEIADYTTAFGARPKLSRTPEAV